jgi:hypothetical protein
MEWSKARRARRLQEDEEFAPAAAPGAPLGAAPSVASQRRPKGKRVASNVVDLTGIRDTVDLTESDGRDDSGGASRPVLHSDDAYTVDGEMVDEAKEYAEMIRKTRGDPRDMDSRFIMLIGRINLVLDQYKRICNLAAINNRLISAAEMRAQCATWAIPPTERAMLNEYAKVWDEVRAEHPASIARRAERKERIRTAQEALDQARRDVGDLAHRHATEAEETKRRKQLDVAHNESVRRQFGFGFDSEEMKKLVAESIQASRLEAEAEDRAAQNATYDDLGTP